MPSIARRAAEGCAATEGRPSGMPCVDFFLRKQKEERSNCEGCRGVEERQLPKPGNAAQIYGDFFRYCSLNKERHSLSKVCV